MKIVILAPSGVLPPDVRVDLPEEAAVFAVSLVGSATSDVVSLAVDPPSALFQRIEGWMMRTPPGRVLRRLTPLDPGVAFWRATRRSQRVRMLLEDANVIVAVERDALYGAWRWARQRRSDAKLVAVVSGYPAARVAARRAVDPNDGQ